MNNNVFRSLGTEWLGDQMSRIYNHCAAANKFNYAFVASTVCGDRELYSALKNNTAAFQIAAHEVIITGILEIIEGVKENVKMD